jgi:CHASE3 domain sensor protein
MAAKSKKKTKKKQVKAPQEKKAKTVMDKLKPLIDDVPSTEYDKIFEQKLAEQYRLFRSLKEHHLQTKKFIRILIVLLVIILLAVLLISFSS